MSNWAIVVLERELQDLQALYGDETIKKDNRQRAVAIKYSQVQAAIKKLNGGKCNDNNAE